MYKNTNGRHVDAKHKNKTPSNPTHFNDEYVAEENLGAAPHVPNFPPRSPDIPKRGTFKRKFSSPLGKEKETSDLDKMLLAKEKDKYIDRAQARRRQYKRKELFPGDIFPQTGRWSYERPPESRVFGSPRFFEEEIFINPALGHLRKAEDAKNILGYFFMAYINTMSEEALSNLNELSARIDIYYEMEAFYDSDAGQTVDDDEAMATCMFYRKSISTQVAQLHNYCVSHATTETQSSSTPDPFTEGQIEPQMWSGLPMKVTVDDTTADLLSTISEDISSAAESITAATSNIKFSLDAQTSELFEQISTDICSAANNVSQAVAGGSTINLSPSQSFAENIAKMGDIGNDLVVLCFVIAIICVWKPKTTREKAALVAMIGVYLMAKGTLPDLLKNASFLSWAKTPVVENTQPESFMLEDISTVISGLLSSYMVAKSGREMFKPSELAKVVSICGRMKMGVKSITDALGVIMMFIHSSIDAWYTGNPFYVQSGSGFVDEFILEAKRIMKLFDEKKLFNMQSSYDRVCAAITVGESIGIKIPGNADNAGLRKHIYDLCNELKKIKRSLTDSNFKFTGCRQEPVAIMLRGPPGAGKSQAMMHLANAINALTLKGEDFKNYEASPGTFTFNRMAETIHWDGYLQTHNIVFIDDMLQAREMQGNPECESMMCVRMVNIFENKLHMAALEGKGNTNFRSKFVIANTNTRNYENVLDAVNHPEAFLRRWDVIVDVIPKKEFCVDPQAVPWRRSLDPSKLPTYCPDTPGYDSSKEHLIGSTLITPDVCEFHVQRHLAHSVTIIDTGVVLDFKELVFKVREIYVNKCNWNETFQEGLTQTIKNYRKVYDTENLEQEEGIEMEDVEIQPEIGDNIGTDPAVLGLAYESEILFQLGNSLESDLRIVQQNSHYNWHYMQIFMPQCWQRFVHADKRFDAKETLEFLFSELKRLGFDVLQPDCPQININIHELIEFVFGQMENKDHPIISRKVWDRLYAESDKIVFTLRNTVNAPPWALRIRDYYKMSYAWVRTLGSNCYNMWSSVMFGEETDVFKNFTVCVVNGMALRGIVELISYLFTGNSITQNVSSFFGSDNQSQSGVKSERLRRARIVRPRGVQPQSSAFKDPNSNLSQLMKAVRLHNCFEVWMPLVKSERTSTTTHYRPGFSLGLRGRTMMMPYHFLSALDTDLETGHISETDLVYFTRAGHKYKAIELTVEEVLASLVDIDEARSEDLALLALPKQVNAFKGILNYVAPRRLHDVYTKVQIAIMIPREDYVVESTLAKQVLQVPVGGGNTNWDPFTIGHAYAYNSCTDKGDCGSLVFVQDNSTGCQLIGMHVAGGGTRGFATRLEFDKIADWLKIVDDLRGSFVPDIVDIPLNVVESLDAPRPNVLLHGDISPASAAPRTSLTTKIVRSPLHGLLGPVEKVPARLGPFKNDEGILIKPMEKALDRYCEEDKYIPKDLIAIASDSLLDYLESESTYFVDRSVMDYFVAVRGDNSGIFSGIPRGTSAGFPDCMKPGGSTKARFWGSTEVYDFENPIAKELEATVHSIVERAKLGMRTRHYFLDFLKDERLKKAKVEKGETRLISASPTPLLIAFRMYFGSFIKWCVANKIVNGFAIGINEYSEDWNILSKLLLQFGGAGIGAGDHKGFDTKHKNVTAWAILDIINRWYDGSKQEQLVREVLWREIVNSFHINLGRLFEWVCPLPSGSPPTTMFNCMENALNFRLASYKLISPSFDFNKHVYACFLGDDNVFAVHALYQDKFNEVTLQKAMLELGYVYTPEDKDLKEFGGPRKITEISFLKRMFRLHEKTGTYMAPLEMLSIFDMLNWTKKSPNLLGDVESNVTTALEELTLHGRKIFEEKKRLILEAVDATGVLSRPLNTNFDFLFSKVNSRDQGYTLQTTLFPDYDMVEYKNPERLTAQIDHGRLKQEAGGLFSLTPRIPGWQPQSNPGPSGRIQRVTRLVSYNGVATNTNSVTRTLSAEEAPGHTDQGTFETERTMPIAAQNSGTTKDSVDAETPMTEVTKYVPLSPSVLDQARVGTPQDVRSFLAKPYIITSGSFTTSNVYGTFIWSSSIPQALLYSINVWKEKVQGNFAFRGTLVLTLQVNATRFQQGRYMLCWAPSGGGNNAQKWFLMHAATLCQATQLPHVEIDIACDTEATLRIPHITAQGWAALDFPGSSTYGNNGYVFLAAYSPLQLSTGSTTCGYTILGHWEDVELSLPIAPQMDVRSGGRVKRRVRNADVEQDSQGLGPISGALQKVSTTSSMLAGIPLLSSIAAPVSWASNILSQVASIWGYSKPHNAAATTSMARYIVNRFTNADTADASTKLGFLDSNEIEDLPGFAGTDIDEMALSYVGSISAYWRKIDWLTSGAPGDLLLNTAIGPRQFYSSTLINAVPIYHLTPITFVSSLFALYKGSVKLTFKIVKTEFHSGRLMLTFYPRDASVNAAYPAATNAKTAYCLREIIDVRYGNEFSFILPYSSLTPYRSAAGPDADYGTVVVSILNALVAPANVSATVPIFIEASAGPDFEWAQPTDIAGQIVQVAVPQMSRTNVCAIVDGVVGGATVQLDSQSSRLCIGERVLSLKTLTKRFTQVVPRLGGEFTMNKYFNLLPFMNWCRYMEGVITGLPSVQDDALNLISSCYALSRGGVRIKIVNTDVNANCMPVAVSLPTVGSTYNPAFSNYAWSVTPSTTIATQFPWRPHRPAGIFRPDSNGGVEIEFPYYNRTHSTALCDTYAVVPVGNAINPDWKGPIPRVASYVYYSVVPTSPAIVYRAASEDHHLGLFMSVPPIVEYDPDFVG